MEYCFFTSCIMVTVAKLLPFWHNAFTSLLPPVCSNLDQNTVVHVWKEKSTMDAVLTAGYNALLSDEDLWYLEYVLLP